MKMEIISWKCPDLQLQPQLSPTQLPDSNKPFPASLGMVLSWGFSSRALTLSFPWMTPQSLVVLRSYLKAGIPLPACCASHTASISLENHLFQSLGEGGGNDRC